MATVLQKAQFQFSSLGLLAVCCPLLRECLSAPRYCLTPGSGDMTLPRVCCCFDVILATATSGHLRGFLQYSPDVILLSAVRPLVPRGHCWLVLGSAMPSLSLICARQVNRLFLRRKGVRPIPARFLMPRAVEVFGVSGFSARDSGSFWRHFQPGSEQRWAC